MTRNLLLFTSFLALSACSIQFDSQYGIRIEPAKIEADAPRPHSKSAETWNAIGPVEYAQTVESENVAHYAGQESALEIALVGEDLEFYPIGSDFSAPTAGANDYLDGPKIEMESIAQAPMVQEFDSPSPVTPAIDAAENEPSILKAWIMWGIPVLLMFFGIGFLLNFGLHWYYLGKMRRASKSTYIWSLTLSATLVAAVLNWLELSILAALVGIFVLLPLVAIQLIRVIKDASLLNKMAKRAARNPFKARQRSA
jgi:hypothetical protein